MKKIFPGTDTLAERKRFFLFHTSTLLIAPIITALIIFTINWSEAIGRKTPVSVASSLNPFLDVGNWLLCSLFVWNFLGSVRIFNDNIKTKGYIIANMMSLPYLLFFPLFYIYNIWFICNSKCQLNKRNKKK